MAGKLDGQVAFVTGSSRGIGRNIALELAKEGTSIVVAARTEEENPKLPGTIHSVAKQIEALGTGARALAVRCNLADEDSVRAAIDHAFNEFGRIDILVNNAAILPIARTLDQEVRHWDLAWRINVRGTLLCTRLIVPRMIEKRQGVVINISSRAAREGREGRAVYSITKRGVELMIEALAKEEAGKGVRFFSMQPERVVITEGARLTGRDKIPDSQTEPPEAMGLAAVYLATDAPETLSGRHFASLSLLRDIGEGKQPTPLVT